MVQVETQVMNTIIAVRETEIDIAPTELYTMYVFESLAIASCVFVNYRREIDGVAFLTLDYTAL